MDRRDFLRSAGLAISIPVSGCFTRKHAAALPAIVTRPSRELVFTTPYAALSGGISDEAFRLARSIEAASNGRWRVHLERRAGGSIAAMAAGADLHFSSEHENVGHEPALTYFAGLPGTAAVPHDKFIAWLRSIEARTQWDLALRPYGLKSLLAAHAGVSAGLWTTKPLDTFTGTSVAVCGLAKEVVKGMGGNAVALTDQNAATALQRKEVAAAELPNIEEAIATNLMTVAPNCLSPGLYANGNVYALSVRLGLWESLSGFERQFLGAVVDRHFATSLQWQRMNSAALHSLTERLSAVAFVSPNPALRAALDRVCEAVVADMATSSPLARRLTRSYEDFRRTFSQSS